MKSEVGNPTSELKSLQPENFRAFTVPHGTPVEICPSCLAPAPKLRKIFLTVELEEPPQVFHTERNECDACCQTVIKYMKERLDNELSAVPDRDNS